MLCYSIVQCLESHRQELSPRSVSVNADGNQNEPTQRLDLTDGDSPFKQESYLGTKLKGRYLIEKELGRGGIAVVYIGRDEELHSRPVVVKILLESNQNEWLEKKFHQEIEALARINHPGVVGILDAGQMHDGKPFLVMQYVEGANLRSLMRADGMALEQIAHVMHQITRALAAAHEKGVYHRDLKPENIMLQDLGEEGQIVKLIDFGIATVKSSKITTSSDTTAIAGTVAYMAPEQLIGKPSASSDIYALGVVAYEMVTGRRPFNPDSPYQLYELQRAGVRVKPKDLRPSLPDPAQEVILKALSFDPGDRHSRAQEFGDELAQSLTLKATAKRTNNLPAEPTSLIGRATEVTAVENLLQREEVRLLTLTGPGGIGKTRLALQVAANVIDNFEDGVFLIALGTIADPDLVASTIAQTLSVRETGGQPLIDSLVDYLRNKQMLLLLDNFEQVVSAAPIAAALLAACPRLKFLVTSRAPLHLRGEHQFVVPCLALPNPKQLPPIESLSQYAAVALFIQRALAVNRHFAVTNENAPAVAEICTRLDGLPLAIELAAARIKLLPPQTILARLESRLKVLTDGARDLPARQQTMRGAIAWSYGLLDKSEQTLFRRLAVFSGGFELDAAEAVCNCANDPQSEVLDGIASLVDKSLLRQEEGLRGEARFVMLETVREYGLESLSMSGESGALRKQHSRFFLSLAEEAEPHLTVAKQQVWLERLEENLENLRAALRWILERGEVDEGLRMASALWWFWHIRGYLSEGRGWLEAFLRLAESSDVTPSVRAKALNAAGGLATDQGDLEQAVKRYAESLAVAQQFGDRRRQAISLNNLGTVAQTKGDYDRAAALFDESLLITRELGDKQSNAILLLNLGVLAGIQRRYDRAATLFNESLSIAQELDNKWFMAALLNSRADVAQYEGDFERAVALYKESLAIRQVLGDKIGIASCLEGLAGSAYAQTLLERCARLLAAAQAICDAIGASLQRTISPVHGYSLAAVRTGLSDRVFEAAWAHGETMTIEQAIAYAFEEAPQ